MESFTDLFVDQIARAELNLQEARQFTKGSDQRRNLLAEAQVHATLAVAFATRAAREPES